MEDYILDNSSIKKSMDLENKFITMVRNIKGSGNKERNLGKENIPM